MADGRRDVIVTEHHCSSLETLNLHNKVDFFSVAKNNHKNSSVGVIFLDLRPKSCDCVFCPVCHRILDINNDSLRVNWGLVSRTTSNHTDSRQIFD